MMFTTTQSITVLENDKWTVHFNFSLHLQAIEPLHNQNQHYTPTFDALIILTTILARHLLRQSVKKVTNLLQTTVNIRQVLH